MSYFDQVFSNFDEQRAVEAVSKAEERAVRAQAEAESERKLLEAYRAWKAIQAGTVETETNSVQPVVNPKGARVSLYGSSHSPTGREAIRAFFREHPDSELSIPELANAMGLTEADHKRLGLSLIRLAKDRELHRPRKGLYRLPSATVAAAAEEEREAVPVNGSQEGPGTAVQHAELFGLVRPAPGLGPGSSD